MSSEPTAERHVHHWLLPDDVTWAELDAIARAEGGTCTQDLPRSFGDAARRVWAFDDPDGSGPSTWLAVTDFHHFDVRQLTIESVSPESLTQLAARVPRIEPEVAWTWAESSEPRERMRGIRSLALLNQPWCSQLADLLKAGLADPQPGLRWTTIRAISVGRWVEAAELLREHVRTGHGREGSERECEICERLAALLVEAPLPD